MSTVAARTGWPCLGVVPWIGAAGRLPAEDAIVLKRAGSREPGRLEVVAPMLSRIASFDDADPLRLKPDIAFTFVPRLPADRCRATRMCCCCWVRSPPSPISPFCGRKD